VLLKQVSLCGVLRLCGKGEWDGKGILRERDVLK
jgi:hypothetical protein